MKGGPLIQTRYRMPLRVAAVFIGYFIYRFVGDARVIPGAMVGFGSILVIWAVVEELSLIKGQRSGLLQVGSALLGIGLICVGGFLTVR